MSQSDRPEFPKIMTYEEYRAAHPAPRATEPPVHRVNIPAHFRVGQADSEASHAAPRPVAAAMEPEYELTSHNYDGIQEYDNPTPGWWYLIFGVSFVFCVLYLVIIQLGGLVHSPQQRHAIVQAAADERRFAELSKIPMSEDKILQIMAKPAWLAQGQGIFESTCALCHMADGSGSVGPNLTDENFKNIAVLMDIPNLIITGAGNGAMPSQQNTLNENEIALVAAYAASLRGQNLPTGPTVNPELTGVPIAPWPERQPEDGEPAPSG